MASHNIIEDRDSAAFSPFDDDDNNIAVNRHSERESHFSHHNRFYLLIFCLSRSNRTDSYRLLRRYTKVTFIVYKHRGKHIVYLQCLGENSVHAICLQQQDPTRITD